MSSRITQAIEDAKKACSLYEEDDPPRPMLLAIEYNNLAYFHSFSHDPYWAIYICGPLSSTLGSRTSTSAGPTSAHNIRHSYSRARRTSGGEPSPATPTLD